MWCSWRTVSAPSGASRYQPLIGAEQATSLAGGLDLFTKPYGTRMKKVSGTAFMMKENWVRCCSKWISNIRLNYHNLVSNDLVIEKKTMLLTKYTRLTNI